MKKQLTLLLAVLFLGGGIFGTFYYQRGLTRERRLHSYQMAITNVIWEAANIDCSEVTETKRWTVTNFSAPKFIAGLHHVDATACPVKFQIAWLDFIHVYEKLFQSNLDTLADAASGFVQAGAGVWTKDGKLAENGFSKLKSPDADEARRNLENVAAEYGAQIHH